MITDNWKEQALQKIAASAPQDDKAVAEAFAQQAYTVIGNRDREIMRDPYMLGFEVVYKNEENTRLVGVFAFRLPSEILLAPVFYNNGQVKGQDLLYRKGANRFVPNTEKWVNYLLSRGETEEGRPISRRNSHARMNLDLAQLGGSRLKSAAEMCGDCNKPEAECNRETCKDELPKTASGEVDIKALWKEAMDAWSVTEPQHLFADFLISSGMQKQASQLAGVFPEWAELLELSGALEKGAGWGAQPTEPTRPTESTVAAPEMLAAPIVPAPQPFTVSEEETEQKMASTVEQTQAENARLQQAGGSAAASNSAIQAGFTGPKMNTPEFEKELDESIKEVLDTPEMQSKLKTPINYPKTPDEQYMAPGQKKADVTLFLAPQLGWAEEQIQDFYKQGFALMDSRDMVGLTEAFERSDYEQSLASITEPGIHEVRDLQGNTARVLWAPKMECKSDCRPMGTRLSYRRRRLTQPYSMLFLDGSDKGAYKDYCESTEETELPAFVMDQTWNPEKIEEGLDNVKAGKVYCAWVPSAGRITAPFAVASVKTVENVTKINFDTTCSGRTCPKMVINKELTGTDLDDSREGPLVLGGDAKFFEVQAAIEYEGPKSPANISWFSPVPPAEFRPVTVGRLGESLIKTKTASVKLIPVGRGRVDLMLNGKRRAEDLDKAALSLKLAGNLGLSIADALAYAERGAKEVTEFNLISPRQQLKLAAAYMGLTEVEYLQKQAMAYTEQRAEDFDALMKVAGIEDPDRASSFLGRYLAAGSVTDSIGGNKQRIMEELDPDDEIRRNNVLLSPEQYAKQRELAYKYMPQQLRRSNAGGYGKNALLYAILGSLGGAGIGGARDGLEGAGIGAGIGAGVGGLAGVLGKAWAEYKENKISDEDIRRMSLQQKDRGMMADLFMPGTNIYDAYQAGKPKAAAAYYDRDIIPDEEFEDRDYDQDLDIPVYSPEENRAIVEFRRQQQVTAQPNYLDAMGYGGPRNRRHGAPQFIPDQVIMQMQNPVQQMAEIGQQLGLKSLMDHGAVGSMTKIFDAAPHIKKYVGQLEASLDFMARLLFMLFWKPKDFADIFGSDDIPNMENKLTGVFLAYGDLVLELKQSAGDDDQQTPGGM